MKLLKPIKDRILVRLVELEKKQGLLIYPDEKKDYQIGHVISIGADLVYCGFGMVQEIFVGHYVYTRKYAGLVLEYDGQDYVSLKIDEILAVSEELA